MTSRPMPQNAVLGDHIVTKVPAIPKQSCEASQLVQRLPQGERKKRSRIAANTDRSRMCSEAFNSASSCKDDGCKGCEMNMIYVVQDSDKDLERADNAIRSSAMVAGDATMADDDVASTAGDDVATTVRDDATYMKTTAGDVSLSPGGDATTMVRDDVATDTTMDMDVRVDMATDTTMDMDATMDAAMTCSDGTAVEIPLTLWPDSFEVVDDDKCGDAQLGGEAAICTVGAQELRPIAKQVRIVEERLDGTKHVSKARISAAEKKKKRKAKLKAERDQSCEDIITPGQLERARTAYEVFHKLPLNSSTDSQVKE